MRLIDVGARTLETAEGGDPAGIPVVVHHGTPGAAVLHPDWEPLAAAAGLRLVTYSRPGYGRSTRDAGRNFASAAADTAALADALGIGRFLTWGYSGGGPHALACAALLPERVVAVAVLASVAPYGAPGLDFMDGMAEGNVEEFGLALEGGEQAIRPATDEQAAAVRSIDVEAFAESMAPYVTPADAEELRGPIAATLLRGFQHGTSVSTDGWIDDDLAAVAPWGFAVEQVRVPAMLWQGRLDAMVPFGHGRWLADRIPGVEAHLTDDDGHLSLLTRRAAEALSWLRARWDADRR